MKFARAAERLANGILMTGGALCLAVLAYFLYFYSWTGSRQFSRAWGPYFYYGAPIVAAVLLFGALALNRGRKIKLAFLISSTIASVYLGELLTTLWFARPTVQLGEIRAALVRAAEAQGVRFDGRTKIEVVNDLRQKATDAVPSMYARGLLTESGDGTVRSYIVNDGVELLPLGSISDHATVVCNENGEYLIYSSDEHGFNNPGALWQDQNVDMVAVGDSFTQGWCVAEESSFINRVRSKHPGILNLGIENNGPLMELAALREYAEFAKPKVVLWFFYEGNDFVDLNVERRSPLLTRYLTSGFSQKLMDRQAEIDRELRDYIDQFAGRNPLLVCLEEEWEILTHPDRWGNGVSGLIKLSTLRQHLGLIGGQQAEVSAEQPSLGGDGSHAPGIEPLLEVFAATLSTAKREVNEWGGEIYFIYLPERERYIKGGHPFLYRSQVLEVVAASGLRLVDMHEVFKRQNDPMALFPFGIAGHYNDLGHSLVSQEVLHALGEPANQASLDPRNP
jgi:hypothetical protein